MDRRQFLVVTGHGLGVVGLGAASGCALFDKHGSEASAALGFDVPHTAGDAHHVFHGGQPAFLIDPHGHQVHDLAGNAQGSVLNASASRFDAGELNFPLDAEVASNGRTYVLDAGNCRVVVFDQSGNRLATIDPRMQYPQDLHVRGDELWICDTLEHEVHVLSLEGEELRTIGGLGFDQGELNAPCSIAFDADGNAHVLELGNCRVQVFAPDGGSLGTYASFGDDGLARPRSIVVLADGRACIADATSGKIHVYSPDGEPLGAFRPQGEGGEPVVPVRLSLTPDGGLYVWTQGLESPDA